MEVIVKTNPLSEDQADKLIHRERNGRARKFVLKLFGIQKRRAAKDKSNPIGYVVQGMPAPESIRATLLLMTPV